MTEQTQTEQQIGPRARVIARILGWDVIPSTDEDTSAHAQHYREEHAEFLTPEGMEVYANSNGYGNKGKLHVSFSWPRDARGQMHRPSDYAQPPAPATSINVSMTKDDVQIAKEIRRRLIDPGMPAWTEQKQRAASADQYTDRGWAIACDVAKAFGQPVPPRGERHNDREPRREHTVRVPLGEYARVTINGSGVTLPTISTQTADQAVAIIRAIAAILAEGDQS